jgi:sugar O-acyltransferase (sialic acid O-acetyltransferase NeuD family)
LSLSKANQPSKPVIILGSGGHARVILDVLRLTGKDVLGVVTPNRKVDSAFVGLKVLGGDDAIESYSSSDVVLVNGVGALPYQKTRWQLAMRMRKLGFKFLTIIHPSAIVANDVELAEGAQIMAGVVIQPGTTIGRDSIINTGVLVDHDCEISRNCHLAPGVVMSGGVSVGSGTQIGCGTTIIQNISIGEGSLIAAGSVIYRDVRDAIFFKQLRSEKLESFEI